MEMDIMDSLQVVSDVAVWVWIQSLFLVLYVSGKGQERVQHPSGSSVPAEGSRWQGSHCLGSGVLNVLVALSVVLQISVLTSKQFLILYLNSH